MASICVASTGPRPKPSSGNIDSMRPWFMPRRFGCDASPVAATAEAMYAPSVAPIAALISSRPPTAPAMPVMPHMTEKISKRWDDDRATADLVCEVAQEDSEHAPAQPQNAEDIADVLATQVQIACNRWNQWSDQPAIEADEAEAERQRRDGLPLIGCVAQCPDMRLTVVRPLSKNPALYFAASEPSTACR